MGIIAADQITLSKVIDIESVIRYYKLQSSMLDAPIKPTTNPPIGWTTTEPSYDSESTSTLYFVDCNEYSDGHFEFSDVSKSSSYDAAKDALSKANKAQSSVDEFDKVLRFDDSEIVIGKTGENTSLKLVNDEVSINEGNKKAASFKNNLLALGSGYLKLGYGQENGNIHSGSYFMSDTSNTIDIFVNDIASPDKNCYGASVQLNNYGAYYGSKMTGGEGCIGVYSNDVEGVVVGSIVRLDADRVHLNALKDLTYTIPSTDRDCNEILISGKWWMTSENQNVPTSKNGCLEVLYQSEEYCHQSYTAIDGTVYTRVLQSGKWSSWITINEDTGWTFWWYDSANNYAGYRRKNGFVEVASKSAGGKTLAIKGILEYTLPEGFRPSVSIGNLGSAQDYRGYEIQLIVNPSGKVQIMNLDPSVTRNYWATNIMFISN